MEYDTEYCFSATTKFLSMPVQCRSSPPYCITTPAGASRAEHTGGLLRYNLVCTWFVFSTTHTCMRVRPVFLISGSPASTDPVIGQLLRVVVGIVVPSVCMCTLAVVGYLLHNYLTGKGQKSPYILVMQTRTFSIRGTQCS